MIASGSGDEPYAEHDGAVLLLLLLAGLVAVLGLTLRGITGLVRARRTGPGGQVFLAPAAVLAWGATAGMYTWGLLHLFFFDDHAQAQACHRVLGSGEVSGYVPTFLPLHFGCRAGDGRVVEAVIPSYLNPATALLGIAALTLTGFAVTRRTREAVPE
ncbi:hypothetical protein [Streptomyces sp. DH41]|uniref:hypothetical protein n=1 Tax=Streptomyces sp. DH41 TaxID=3040125 RepID=UPI0024435627|nr:hypothetical protein [Streptomyces sp. DH41]MDG9725724.1 hypothetical protein [Streptomyces sp. DH41]